MKRRGVANMLWGNVKIPNIPDAPADGKTYGRKDKAWAEVTGYNWKLHSPEQITGYLAVPTGVAVNVDGTGAVIESVAAGQLKITAINANGETTAADVPAFDVLADSTQAMVSWTAVTGANGYRVYNTATGYYKAVTGVGINYIGFVFDTVGTPPSENTAAIYQSPFTIEKDDTVEITADGLDVETSVDPLDSTKKRIHLTVNPGLDGLSAYEVAVANGFVGTEAEWLASLVGDDGYTPVKGVDYFDGDDGTDGLSAYEVAVSNGFVGTEAEWLESLQGTDGIDGTDATANFKVSDNTDEATVNNGETLTVKGSGSIGVTLDPLTKTFTVSASGGEFLIIPNYYVTNLAQFVAAYNDISANYNGGNIYINGVVQLTANLTLDLTGINIYGTGTFGTIKFCNASYPTAPVYRMIITAGSPMFYNVIFSGSDENPPNDLATWTNRYIFELTNSTSGSIVFDRCNFSDIVGGVEGPVIKYTGAAIANCFFQITFTNCKIGSHSGGAAESDSFEYSGLSIAFGNANTRLWVYIFDEIAENGTTTLAKPLNNSSCKFNLKAPVQPAAVQLYSDETVFVSTNEVTNSARHTVISVIEEYTGTLAETDFVTVHIGSEGNIKKVKAIALGAEGPAGEGIGDHLIAYNHDLMKLETFGIACSDMTTDITTGEKAVFDIPFDFVATRIYASIKTAPTGSAFTIDIEDEGASILNAVLSIAAGTNNAETSVFAASASNYSFTKGDLISIDVDQVGSTVAGAGLIVFIEGYRA